MFESLANEVLSSSFSPHVRYYVLPYLMNSDIDLLTLVHSILVGVSKEGVTPSLELLYSIIQLIHSKFNSPRFSEQLVLDYLQLVSTLLRHIPSSHVPADDAGGVEADDAMSTEEEKEEDGGNLSSHDAMLRHCLATIGGEEFTSYLHFKK